MDIKVILSKDINNYGPDDTMSETEILSYLKAYAQHCEDNIRQAYPEAKVEVTYQDIHRHAIRLDTDDALLASEVQDIVEESWGSFIFEPLKF